MLLKNKEQRAIELFDLGYSLNKIATQIHSCPGDISRFIKSTGRKIIPNSIKGQNKKSHTCRYCGIVFLAYGDRSFCSKKCKDEGARIWTEEKILKTIRAKRNNKGMVTSDGEATLATVARRMFGSWALACEIAGCIPAINKTSNCSICGKRIDHSNGNRNYCSKECSQIGKVRMWKRYWNVRRTIYKDGDLFDAEEIFDRDDWNCHICGKPINPSEKHPAPMSATIDHLIPILKGGRHIRENVKAAHLRCNIQKGTDIP